VSHCRGFRVCLIGDFNATADACDSAHEQESNQQRTPGPSRLWLRAMLGWNDAAASASNRHGCSANQDASAISAGMDSACAPSLAPHPPPPALARPPSLSSGSSQPPPDDLHATGWAKTTTAVITSSLSFRSPDLPVLSVPSAPSLSTGEHRASLLASDRPEGIPVLRDSLSGGDTVRADRLPADHTAWSADADDLLSWPDHPPPADHPASPADRPDPLASPGPLSYPSSTGVPFASPSAPPTDALSALSDALSSLGTGGFADAFRLLHPQARRAYTCFHVAAGCDVTNHGCRIDLALLSPPPRVGGQRHPTNAPPAALCADSGSLGIEDAPSPVPERDATTAIATSTSATAPTAAGAANCTAMVGGSYDTWQLLRSEILPLQGSDHLAIRLALRGMALPAVPPGPHPVSSARRLGSQSTLSSAFARAVAVAAAAAEASAEKGEKGVGLCVAGASAGGVIRVPGAGMQGQAVSSAADDLLLASAADQGSPAAPTYKSPKALAGALPPSSGRKGGKAGKRESGSTPALTTFFAPKAAGVKAVATAAEPTRDCPAAGCPSAHGAVGCASPPAGTALPVCASTVAAGMPAAHSSSVLAAQASGPAGEEPAALVGGARVGGGGISHDCVLGPSHGLGAEQGEAWRALRQRMSAATPRCTGHGEVCRLLTVKKPGVNNGREFWTCPRAEGPKARRECNCGFFLWNDEWRRRGAGAKRSRAE
jgi:hypothetical protein